MDELTEPGPQGQAHDNWNVAVNGDDDGQDDKPRGTRRR